jgi:hypothetical protein
MRKTVWWTAGLLIILAVITSLALAFIAKEVTLTDFLLDGVRLDYVHATTTAQSEKHVAKEVARAAEEANNHPNLLLRTTGGRF